MAGGTHTLKGGGSFLSFAHSCWPVRSRPPVRVRCAYIHRWRDLCLHAQRMPFTVRTRVAALPLSPQGGGGGGVVDERGPEGKENAKKSQRKTVIQMSIRDVNVHAQGGGRERGTARGEEKTQERQGHLFQLWPARCVRLLHATFLSPSFPPPNIQCAQRYKHAFKAIACV